MPAALKSSRSTKRDVVDKTVESELYARVAVLEKQVSLDETELAEKRVDINKLASVMSALKEMISLQTLQIKTHDESDRELRQSISRNREDFQLNTEKTREELITTIKESLGNAPNRLTVLEQHGLSMDDTMDKHTASIDRLAEIASSLKEMLLVQNQRLQVQEQESLRTTASLQEHRVENNSEFISLNTSIQTSMKEMLVAMTNDTDRKVAALSGILTNYQIADKEEHVKSTARVAAAEVKTAAAETKQELARKEVDEKLESEYTKLRIRLEKLEKWWWIAIGGAVVFLIASKLVDAGVLVHLLTL